MKTKRIFIVLLGVMFLAGCGGQLSQLPPSPEKTYAQALTAFNDASEAYVAALSLQTPDVKAQWKRDINPMLDAADTALNLWWSVIGTEQEDEAEFDYLKLWRELFPLLFTMGIIEVE